MEKTLRHLACAIVAALVVGAAGAPVSLFAQQGGGGSPLSPEVLFIDFPPQIASDGSKFYGRVGFEYTDADIILAQFDVVDATEFEPFSFNPKIEGRSEGVFEFFVFSKIEQVISLKVTLIDKAGNKSFPKEFKFQAISTIEIIDQWGSLGVGFSQFMDIGALAIDSQENIYVTDIANHRIQKFSKSGDFLFQLGGKGADRGRLDGPVGIAIDLFDNIYVAEAGNRRVQKFDKSGNSLLMWGSFGNGNGQFNQPSGIAVDRNGQVYVLDQSTGLVQVFTATGTFQTKWGGLGSNDEQLLSPMDITIDPQDNVFIADTGNNRISRYTTDGSFVSHWGRGGPRDGEFTEPRGVALDFEGNLYVSDKGNHRIQKFTKEGVFLAKTGSEGSAAGELRGPVDLVVDRQLNLYIGDEGNHRIQVLRFKTSQ